MIEGRPHFYVRLERNPCLPVGTGPLPSVALVKCPMGNDTRMLEALAGLGYAGAVIEGMGAGHVHADAAPVVGELARAMPVILASRAMTGPVFTHTYGYPGAEIDLLGRGVLAAGYLSGLKARLLLSLALRAGSDRKAIERAFAVYA
jgi:L-asparaginase